MSGQTAMIDAPSAQPVLDVLDSKGWTLDIILNTHHHWDHTGANKALKKQTGCRILGYKGDAARIPMIDVEVEDGQTIEVCGTVARVIFVPGHTLGHIAYYFEKEGLLFCGDTLFAMGCGRLFEGSAQQMYDSLQKFCALPEETKVYCAHEYTQSNGRFALTIEPDNHDLQQRMKEVDVLRAEGKATVPTTIGLERKTNPFVRAVDTDAFAEIRRKKDNF